MYDIIKVCGMRDGDNIREVASLGVNWIGMIFHPDSPRYVSMIPSHAGIMPDMAGDMPDQTDFKRVGVFVDDMMQNVVTRAVNYRLDVIQLHGTEGVIYIDNLRRTLDPDIRPGIKIMKAISIGEADDVKQCEPYFGHVDFFLFDTKCNTHGGSGVKFDWHVLDAYEGQVPFLLSGGIGPDDADSLRAFRHPMCIGIDLNSRFESEPAVKDVSLLKGFLSQLRQ